MKQCLMNVLNLGGGCGAPVSTWAIRVTQQHGLYLEVLLLFALEGCLFATPGGSRPLLLLLQLCALSRVSRLSHALLEKGGPVRLLCFLHSP